MSETFRDKFFKFSALRAREGEDSPNVRALAQEMLGEIVFKAKMETVVQYYREGREAEIPPALRNDDLRSMTKGSAIGFTAKID